jgi:hypothetical protein
MLVALHEKHEIDGWRHICTYEHNSDLWSKSELQWIDELINQGDWVLTVGWTMFQIIH